VQGQHRLGILLHDPQQGARRAGGAGAALLPVLERAQVHADEHGELRLAQARLAADRAHVRLADLGYPRARHLRAAHVAAHVLDTGNQFRKCLFIHLLN